MKGSTPIARGRRLKVELARLYDPHAETENVIDMLTDLRHLCDAYDYNFAECDRMAVDHYLEEIGHPKTMKGGGT